MDPRCDRDTELNTDIDMGSDMVGAIVPAQQIFLRTSANQNSPIFRNCCCLSLPVSTSTVCFLTSSVPPFIYGCGSRVPPCVILLVYSAFLSPRLCHKVPPCVLVFGAKRNLK